MDKAKSNAAQTLKAQYQAPYLAHATMEPMNCTVQLLAKANAQGKRAVVYAPTQVPGFARQAAAKALGLDADTVDLKVTYLGGGFGRRLEVDVIAQAAFIAKAFGELSKDKTQDVAIQLIWTRPQDMQNDFYRPASLTRFEATLDKSGAINTWQAKVAAQNIAPQFLPRNAGMPAEGPDKTSPEGEFDQAYEFANAHVTQVAVELPIPIGYWRSVGHSHHAFFQESFLDECAAAAKADPVQYRRALLQKHPKHLAVLDAVAKLANWTGATNPSETGVAYGVAMHECFGSVVAQIAKVSVNGDKSIRVHHIWSAIDCGFAVNPNGIVQQIESCICFGLSAALRGQIDFDKGAVVQSNFHDYAPLRMNEMPEMTVHILPSSNPPEGVGEPSLPPVAPAVANALFALTGQRLRSLPLVLE